MILRPDHRCRSWAPIDDAELADDRTRAEESQDPVLSPRRSYDDFEQALLEPVAAVAGISGNKERLTGFETAGRRTRE
jgi:hypothetical protein